MLRSVVTAIRLFWHNPSKERAFNLRHDAAMRRALIGFAAALAAQVGFWQHTSSIMPDMGIVDDVPGEQTVRALSFGDEEAFFRLLALNIQNSGDMFGRYTPLYKYDFNKLYHWFHLLNRLNDQSNYLAAMGAYYFSQTQNPSDVRYIIDYLDEFTVGRERDKWWWVVQAIYLSNYKMFDLNRSLQLAERLRGVRGIPVWAQQQAAFIHEKRGEFGDAARIIQEIIAHEAEYSLSELRFMKYFMNERINKYNDVRKQLEEIEQRKEAEAAKAKAEGRTLPEPNNGPPDDVGAFGSGR